MGYFIISGFVKIEYLYSVVYFSNVKNFYRSSIMPTVK